MAGADEDSTSKEENSTPTGNPARSSKGELFDWLTNNLFFAILPLLVSYLALSISRNPVTVLERGDAFVITAALLAPEIGLLRNLKPTTVRNNVTTLLNVMFLLIVLSTILFVTSSSDYNATHPDLPINPEAPTNQINSSAAAAILGTMRREEAGPPFPVLTPTVVYIISVLMLIVTIVLVYCSIRERRRIGGAS